MARPLRVEYPGAFYHVTSRGDEKKEIFKTLGDRERLLEYLSSATDRYGAMIHCYCLMSNHYHLFLETPRGNLSQIMRHINGSYTTYFNVKRKHVGHLLQGRYKAILVEEERYALELSRYVHLNPVRAGIVPAPADYRWSSYSSYIGKEEVPAWLNRRFVLGLLSTDVSASEEQYRQFVEDLIGKEYDSPLQQTVASTILGAQDFVESVIANYVDDQSERPDVPAVRALHRRFAVRNIIARTQEVIEDPVIARDVAVRLCHLYSGETLRNIGSQFGLGESGVTKASMRLELRLKKEVILRQKIQQILESLGRVKVKT